MYRKKKCGQSRKWVEITEIKIWGIWANMWFNLEIVRSDFWGVTKERDV